MSERSDKLTEAEREAQCATIKRDREEQLAAEARRRDDFNTLP